MDAPLNPFPIFGYFGADYFCDREKEKQELIQALRNGRNITLFAPRRIGKTGLIHHVFHYLPKWNCIYLDVQESASFHEFSNTFLGAILNGVSKNNTLFRKFQDWLLALRPVMSSNPHTGKFEIEVDFKSDIQQRATLKESLQLLDSQGPAVIALDEFQHIASWSSDHLAMEGWLRSEIQKLKNVRFIFSGSQFHLLSEMFNSAKRPFYASTQPMNIGKINEKVYRTYILRQFKESGIKIGEADVLEIQTWANGNTYNIQLLCNRVHSKASKRVEPPMIDEAIVEIYSENSLSYFALRGSMTKMQWRVLSAFALEGIVYSPTSKDFIQKYLLGSGSGVLRALDYLIKRELVYKYLNENGDAYYEVYDLILMRWLQKK